MWKVPCTLLDPTPPADAAPSSVRKGGHRRRGCRAGGLWGQLPPSLTLEKRLRPRSGTWASPPAEDPGLTSLTSSRRCGRSDRWRSRDSVFVQRELPGSLGGSPGIRGDTVLIRTATGHVGLRPCDRGHFWRRGGYGCGSWCRRTCDMVPCRAGLGAPSHHSHAASVSSFAL